MSHGCQHPHPQRSCGHSHLGFHEEYDVKLHSGAGVGMARVAHFILGQTDIRESVPFLINCDNVI